MIIIRSRTQRCTVLSWNSSSANVRPKRSDYAYSHSRAALPERFNSSIRHPNFDRIWAGSDNFNSIGDNVSRASHACRHFCTVITPMVPRAHQGLYLRTLIMVLHSRTTKRVKQRSNEVCYILFCFKHSNYYHWLRYSRIMIVTRRECLSSHFDVDIENRLLKDSNFSFFHNCS